MGPFLIYDRGVRHQGDGTELKNMSMILGVGDHYLSIAPAKFTQSYNPMPTVDTCKHYIIQQMVGSESSVYLVKRPSICKARVPDLVHNLDSLRIVLAAWSVHHGPHSPAPDTCLMLLRDSPVVPREKFPCPSAFAA